MITGNGQSLAERQWGTGFHAEQVSGSQAAVGGRPGAVCLEPGGLRDARSARGSSRISSKLNQIRIRSDEQSRDRDADRAVRDGVPDADLGARADRSVEGAGAHLRALRPRFAESPAPSPRIVCWRGAWPSAACGSFSSIIAPGIITRSLPKAIRTACQQIDQPSAGLIQDLKERGLLDDTLVIWGGEFGRTVYSQGKLTADDYGRDHHPRAFTIWMAGGGVKPGITLGETDDYGYNITAGSGARPRSERDDPAVPGDRSHAADLQVSRTPLPADRHRRARLPESARFQRG